MPHKYCNLCDAGMDRPTIRQAVEGTQMCPMCLHPHDVDEDALAGLLEELQEGIDQLKEAINALAK